MSNNVRPVVGFESLYAVTEQTDLPRGKAVCGQHQEHGMNDRELLQAAAKAAGIELVWSNFSNVPTLFKGLSSDEIWDPLADDGDALRLAVTLRITPHIDSNMTDCEDCTEAHLGDPYAATRRAIVRAASAIGGSDE